MKALSRVQIFITKLRSSEKYFLKHLSKLEKITISILLLIIVTTGSWLLLAKGQQNILQPIKGGTIVEGVIGRPQIINPLYSQANQVDQDIVKLVFSGLVKMGKGREFLPDLATSWDIFDKGKKYIFHLRDDVKWHDGKKFDADDVVFTIKVIQSESYMGILGDNWSGIEVATLSPTTVQFVLPNPATFFLSQATLGIIPAHLFAHLPVSDIGDPSNNLKPIGTGIYKAATTLVAKDSLNLIVNDNYYGEQPYIDKLVFYFYDNEKSLFNALNSGTINSAGFTSLSEDKETELPYINKYVYQLPQYKAVFINQLGENQVLKDKLVRQALALATNKAKLIKDVADDNAVAVNSPVLPGFWGHLPEIKKYDFDFIAARDALNRAGWKDSDQDGVLEKNDLRLSFSLSFKDDKINNEIAKILASDWEAIGMEVILNPVESNVLFDQVIRPRNYDALIFGQNLGSDSDPYVYWHSSQAEDPGLALSVMYDKNIDNNLELARLSSSLNRAINYYHRFQNSFADLVPAVLLYQPNFTYLVNEKIKGVTDEINVGNISDRFINISDWYIRYKKTSSKEKSPDIIESETIENSEQ